MSIGFHFSVKNPNFKMPENVIRTSYQKLFRSYIHGVLFVTVGTTLRTCSGTYPTWVSARPSGCGAVTL